MNGLSDVPDGYDYKSKVGAGFGVFLMYTLANIIVMPELSLMWRAFGQETGNTDYNYRFTYLSLAATVLYVIRATAINFVIGLSPNLGYALGGRVKYGDQKEDIEFGDNGAKRMNFGVGINAGIQLQNAMMLRLIYNIGLSKLYNGSDIKSYFIALAFSMPLRSL
jgi:outer membrane protein with beta-barrel domain